MISNASSINRMQSANANNNPKDIAILKPIRMGEESKSEKII